jgi:predicted metal-dependent peptidase
MQVRGPDTGHTESEETAMSNHPTQALPAAGRVRLGLTRLADRYPFHARVLEQFVLQHRPDVGTMGVCVQGDKVLLLFNAKFVLQTPLAQLIGVLLHEVHHVVFGHVLADPDDFPDFWARTVAEEVTVNEYVWERLPPDVITLDQFPDLPLRESTRERYERLKKVPPNQRFPIEIGVILVPGQGRGQRTLDDHGVWGEVVDRQAPQEVLAEVLQQAAWQANVPDELRAAIQAQGIGTQPGHEEYLVRSDARGKLDWRQLLRRYVGQALEPSPSLNRPPRRLPDLVGIVPSRNYRPLRPKVLAIIDSSGSIMDEPLEEIAGELSRLARSHAVTVVECDAAIHKTYAFRGKLEPILGRGGTDLRPPFEPKFLAKHRPDLALYFTDGFGPAPGQAPKVPVIWCLTRGDTPRRRGGGPSTCTVRSEVEAKCAEILGFCTKIRAFVLKCGALYQTRTAISVQKPHISVPTASISVRDPAISVHRRLIRVLLPAVSTQGDPHGRDDRPQPGSIIYSHLHGRRVRLLEWLPDGTAKVADLRNDLPLSLTLRPDEMSAR